MWRGRVDYEPGAYDTTVRLTRVSMQGNCVHNGTIYLTVHDTRRARSSRRTSRSS
ncbi:hypothetical protein [Microbispora bryophytorum]|uniref:hypothetical protein n=1 Tax=Microbispora bryophytorum TaxID=1460882 RepID=UPI001430F8B0|nr:hypothetical protein [Microbispora bryophytorum]MBD3137226.1 hypothetical protein [Microbispora bryophytorum]